MELLQKLTLYDLLGYTLPGGILLIMILWQAPLETVLAVDDLEVFFCIVTLALSYVLGILISEIMRLLLSVIFKEKKEWVRICIKYNITYKAIAVALHNAKMISSEEEITSYDSTVYYIKQMYSDIQVDLKYNRIHNYASAELLYKNMILVAAVYIGVGLVYSSGIFICSGAVGVLGFIVRWKRFYEKKMGYMICWFVEKYRNTCLIAENNSRSATL